VPRLRRIDCAEPGIKRIRRGRGFTYLDTAGDPIADQDELSRLRALGIPPAWRDVWICALANGHIQATGVDAAGRKQYLYHPSWREARDREKYERMEHFAKALPRLRARADADLGAGGLGPDRVLGLSVRLLDVGFFRIGGEEYAEENESFGLATLRRDHVQIKRDAAVFDYPAKSGQRRVFKLADSAALPVLRALKRRPVSGGDSLLAFWEHRAWHDVRSDDVNRYLKAHAGEDFSAKDFRTWNATVLAAAVLAGLDSHELTKSARKRAATAAVKQVAGYLGNTPTVCRKSYIDPRVFDRFDSGETIRAAARRVVAGTNPDEFADRERIERAVLRLLAG
jgi:DNA topoisomerase IB